MNSSTTLFLSLYFSISSLTSWLAYQWFTCIYLPFLSIFSFLFFMDSFYFTPFYITSDHFILQHVISPLPNLTSSLLFISYRISFFPISLYLSSSLDVFTLHLHHTFLSFPFHSFPFYSFLFLSFLFLSFPFPSFFHLSLASSLLTPYALSPFLSLFPILCTYILGAQFLHRAHWSFSSVKSNWSETELHLFQGRVKRRRYGPDMMWCDVMWCDVMWCDVMWCDVMW